MQDRIGFIGLGKMGHGMARSLLQKGAPLTVVAQRRFAPIDDLMARGAREARDLTQLVDQSDIVFLCVGGSGDVEELVRAPNGLKAARRRGLILVDCHGDIGLLRIRQGRRAGDDFVPMLADMVAATNGVSLRDRP